MAEENTQNVDEQPKTGPEPNADPASTAGDSKPAADVPDWVKDPATAYAEIKKLRGEAAENRKHRTEAEEAQRKAEEDRLAQEKKWQELAERRQQELEKLQSDIQARDAALREQSIKNAVIAAAAKAQIADPEDAYRLADLDGVTIEDDGTVAGAEEAVKTLVEAKPYLIADRKPAPGGGQKPAPTNPAGSGKAQHDSSFIMGQLYGKKDPFGTGRVIPPSETE